MTEGRTLRLAARAPIVAAKANARGARLSLALRPLHLPCPKTQRREPSRPGPPPRFAVA